MPTAAHRQLDDGIAYPPDRPPHSVNLTTTSPIRPPDRPSRSANFTTTSPIRPTDRCAPPTITFLPPGQPKLPESHRRKRIQAILPQCLPSAFTSDFVRFAMLDLVNLVPLYHNARLECDTKRMESDARSAHILKRRDKSERAEGNRWKSNLCGCSRSPERDGPGCPAFPA